MKIENYMTSWDNHNSASPYYDGDPICDHCSEPFSELIEFDGFELCDKCLDAYKWLNCD